MYCIIIIKKIKIRKHNNNNNNNMEIQRGHFSSSSLWRFFSSLPRCVVSETIAIAAKARIKNDAINKSVVIDASCTLCVARSGE